MEYVQSNTTNTLHIKKDGWNMHCGQSISNVPVSREDYSNYKVCSKCINKMN